MPQAPLQPGWDCPQAPEIPAKEIIWKSERLKKSRRVWIFTTGDATAEERPLAVLLDGEFWAQSMPVRSEEHTSELQSRFDLVCRLLLEKKKLKKLSNIMDKGYAYRGTD